MEVETQHASPFAGSLLFDYVATYMYEGDTPSAERRAAALSLDRDLLRELLGQEELRELIDPAALEQIEEDLQHRSQRTQATSRDALGDVLRAVGDLRVAELSERVLAGLDVQEMLAALEHERRVVRIRIAGDERLIAADDAGLYRDALGCPPPGGLPDVFLADVPDALVKLVRRYARTHGPFTSEEFLERYRVDASSALRELERSGELVRGELRPGGAGREWCDIQVLRRLRRASLAALRKEIEPVDEHALSAFMPSWQGVDRWRPGSERGGGGGWSACAKCSSPCRAWRCRWPPGSATCSPLVPAPIRLLGWTACAPVARSSGSARARSGATRGVWPCISARTPRCWADPAHLLGARGEPPEQPEHALLRERLAAGPCFFTDLLAELELPGAVLTQALWDLVWAGEVTNDAWAPLRAPRQTLAAHALAGPARARGGGLRGRRFGGPSLRAGRFGTSAQVQGRWSLTLALFGERSSRASRALARPQSRSRARAAALLLNSCSSAMAC